MIRAYIKALAHISDPGFYKPLALSLALSILTYILLFAIIGFFIVETSLSLGTWWEISGGLLGGFGLLVVALFLFPAILSGYIGLFLESVVTLIERKCYPTAQGSYHSSWMENIVTTLRYVGLVVVANLVALSLYFVPILNACVFIGLNGILIGREYFDLVAARHMTREERRTVYHTHRRRILGLGFLTAVLLLVPVINIVVPLVGVAAMLHLFHTLNNKMEPHSPVMGSGTR